ncbi:hypothetical protein IGI50_000329 [Enterococcus sp. DIV0170]
MGKPIRKEGGYLWQLSDEFFVIILGVCILLGLLLDCTGYEGSITVEDSESSSGILTNSASVLFGIAFWLLGGVNFKVATFKKSFFTILVSIIVVDRASCHFYF